MTSVQLSATLAKRALAPVAPRGFEAEDDPCTRLHLYQQQLRAELLSTAHAEATRPGWWRRAWASASQLDRVAGVAQAMEERVRTLTETGAGYAYRHVVAMRAGAREGVVHATS